MKIGQGVSELWRVENLPQSLTWPMAYNSLYYRTSRDRYVPTTINLTILTDRRAMS